MLNYGPIIVTLSTSKYSLVEIRGVFYKSAYRDCILNHAAYLVCYEETSYHLQIDFGSLPVYKIGSRNSPYGIYTLSSVPHKSVNTDSWDYAVFYNPKHYSVDISSQIVPVPYRFSGSHNKF